MIVVLEGEVARYILLLFQAILNRDGHGPIGLRSGPVLKKDGPVRTAVLI